MILSVRRSSGFPILMTPEELSTLDYLEREGLYTQLEDYEKQLRRTDEALHELKVEATKLDEVVFFLQSLNCSDPITIDFRRGLVIIEDAGGLGC